MGKGPEQTFLQRRCMKSQQIYEKMFNITSYQEMQIKITMKYHLIPVRIGIIKKLKDKFWLGCEAMENFLHCQGDYTLVQTPWKIV